MTKGEPLDLIAYIIEKIARGKYRSDQVIEEIVSEFNISKPKVESAYFLAREFGFINTKSDKLEATAEGLNFHRFTDILKEGKTWTPPSPKNILSITLPPKWSISISDETIGAFISTIAAQRRVLNRAEKNIVIVTPFIDPGTFQMIIPDYHHELNCTMITSEKKLKYEKSFVLEKLKDVLERRFGRSKLYYYSELSMILHGKIWLSESALLITSANIKPDSLTDNFEIGIYSEEQTIIDATSNLIDRMLKEPKVECLKSS